MSLDRLSIGGLRNLQSVELHPGAGINWFCGPNGAGKTSVLEAIHIVARGRSFRTATIGRVIQHGKNEVSVVARQRESGTYLGVERRTDGWRGRIAGRDSQRISEFAAHLPLILIEPNSHQLVDGGPEKRRQYLDWLLFHVEHDYLGRWQRYARLLRQRNAALKQQAPDKVLDAIDTPFLAAAERIDELRGRQVSRVGEVVSGLYGDLEFSLPGELGLKYRPGQAAGRSLADALAAGRAGDRERGFTRNGPHRAELVLSSNGHPAAAELSRGQQKLLAILLQLAQLRLLDREASHPPLLLLDDPVSELDSNHLSRLLAWLQGLELQSWVTATMPGGGEMTVFHVEQGGIRPVV